MADINRVISGVEKRLRHAIEQTLEKTAQYAESKLSETFKTEGRAVGIEWSPLREAYLKQKIKKGYSEKILHRTTTLAQSFTSTIQPFSAVIGTPVWYAQFHEYGTKRIPARPFLKHVMEHILGSDVVSRFFKEAINAS